MPNLKFFATLSLVVLLLGSFSPAFGELLVHESFDYAAGSTVFGQGSWSGHDPGAGTTIDANGLTYPGMFTSGGKATMAAGTNNHIKIDNAAVPAIAAAGWDQVDGGTFYMTYLVEGPHMDLWHNPFSAGSISQIRDGNVKVTNSPDAGPSHINASRDGSNTSFVIYRMTMPTSGGDPGSQQLIVDPDLSAGESAAFAGAPSTNAFAISGNEAFIQFSRAPGQGATSIDEFRFATTWAAAVPEPTSLTLFGIAFLLPLLVLSKRQ